MNKKYLASIVIAIIVIIVALYFLFPGAQEVIIQFKDGTETTINSPLSVVYKGKEVNSVILKVNEEIPSCCFNVEARTPEGVIEGHRYDTDRWFFYPQELLDVDSLDRGTYTISVVSDLGEIEFDLELKYDLIIIFR